MIAWLPGLVTIFGSGKSDTPWLRIQRAYANAAVAPESLGEVCLDAEDVVVGLDDPQPTANTGSATIKSAPTTARRPRRHGRMRR